MFTYSIESEPYKTYRFSDPSTDTSMEVVPERGGIVTRWRVQGKDLFYMDEERFLDPKLSVRGGIPILFPICGNLPDNSYTYEDKIYKLKQHGFARELPWEVIKVDSNSISLSLRSNEMTYEGYPFDFEVVFTYILETNRLILEQRYTNSHTSKVMPFCSGIHPYFAVKDKSSLKIDIPGNEFYDQVQKQSFSYRGSFDFSLDEIDAAFTNLTGNKAIVTDEALNTQLIVSYDANYSVLVFWTVKGKDFYCLEPWTAGRNALNTGNNLIHLEPGASLDTSLSFEYNLLS